MPSIKSKLLRGTMKSVKPIITGMNIPDQRKGMDLLRYIHPLPKAVAIRPAEADCPLKGQWRCRRMRWAGKAILYTHGGRVCLGFPVDARALGSPAWPRAPKFR